MAGLLLVLVSAGSAQTRLRATSAAAFLKEPGGIRLGSLVSGQAYATGRANGAHVETTVEGWIPSAAAQATTRDGFDLTLTAGGGEALRASPNGAVVARIQEGTLLNRIGARGSWVRVRRAGWVARSALGAVEPTPDRATVAAAQAKPVPPPPPPAASTAAPPPSTRAATPPAATTQPAPTSGQAARSDSATPSEDAPLREGVAGAATLKPGARVVATRDGKAIALAEGSPDVEVIEQTRDWVKVRIEGWVRAADLASETVAGPKITAAMIQTAPDKYVNQPVTWRLQFLAVQEADALRPEMPRGQLYVLARGPLPESGFTYLMVTKEQAAEFRRLAPLDEVRVDAVVRAGRTKFLPTPVLELVKVVR